MKKFILIPCFLLSLCFSVNAQSATGTVEYDKTPQSAVVNEFPFDEGTTSDAVKAKLKSLGYASKGSKGFDVYKGVKLSELGADTYDLYFKIDKKSKKEKDKSVVSLLISKGYDNFATETADPALFANAKTFVNNLGPAIIAFDLENRIEEQADVVKKADKKYRNSVDDGSDLEKKKRQIEEDIEDNKKEQAAKKAEAAAQLQILETLKAKRVN